MGYKSTVVGGYLSSTGNSTEDMALGQGAASPWFIGAVPSHLYRHFINIALYTDSTMQTPLTPDKTPPYRINAGVATVKVSDNGVTFGDIDGGTVDLTKSDYKRPNMCGTIGALSVSITGVLPTEVHEGKHIYAVVTINSYD